jgi:D-alanine-D-alanine ligase
MIETLFASPRYCPVPSHTRDQIRILLMAKHVFWTGGLHHEDGNHAIYHGEIRDTLKRIGFQVARADSYEALFIRPDCDFIFPLLNRGGFLNSEMMIPLLATRLGIPFLGATPILRGLADDKHLAKLEAQARGVQTAPWAIYRQGAPIDERIAPMTDRMVIKPNASSASWGVRDAGSWAEVRRAVEAIHAEGHDAIVEPFLTGNDIEVPVIQCDGRPAILPMLMFEQDDPSQLRTYAEKRDLAGHAPTYRISEFADHDRADAILSATQRLTDVYMPFDYGRFEYRFDDRTGMVNFMEVNLNCNLWSQKLFARSAALCGISHDQLIETIVGQSLARHGLTGIRRDLAA